MCLKKVAEKLAEIPGATVHREGGTTIVRLPEGRRKIKSWREMGSAIPNAPHNGGRYKRVS